MEVGPGRMVGDSCAAVGERFGVKSTGVDGAEGVSVLTAGTAVGVAAGLQDVSVTIRMTAK